MGQGMSRMASTLLTLGDLLSCVILYPNMSSSVAKKQHFEGLNCTPYLLAFSNISR